MTKTKKEEDGNDEDPRDLVADGRRSFAHSVLPDILSSLVLSIREKPHQQLRPSLLYGSILGFTALNSVQLG